MSENTKLPNDELTELITEKLLKSNLIPSNRIEEIRKLISLGNVRQEDWRSWAELSETARKQEDKDEQ